MSENKRHYQRLVGQATAFIELMGSTIDAPDRAPIIICNSLDISRGGLRVCVDTFIEPGTIYIWVWNWRGWSDLCTW